MVMIDEQDARIVPKRTFQYLAALTGSLNIVSSGMHYGWTSASLPQLLREDSHIPTTNDQGSWIAVALLCGAVSGALLAGAILDKLGRKNVILLTSVPFFASWIMLAYAKSVPVLITARFVAGIPDGLLFCSFPVYLAEISDPGIRGLLGSSLVVSLALGSLLMSIIGSCLSITATALVSSTLPVLLLLTFPWMPESPYHLIMKGNLKQARQSLRTFRGVGDVERELSRIRKAVEEQNANTGKFLDLFTVRSNRRALYIVLGVRAAQQLCGSLAITFYAQVIFKESGDAFSPVFASVIYFGVSMVFSGISSVIVDKSGRRPLMIFSITGSGLILLVEGCYFYVKNATNVDTSGLAAVPIVTLIAFVIIFNVGLQSMPLLLLGEMFPTNVKAFAFSLNDVYYCVLSIIVSKFFQFTKDEFGLHVPFFTFAACCVLSLLFTIWVVPETKGKTLEQIQDELKEKPHHEIVPELQTMFANN